MNIKCFIGTIVFFCCISLVNAQGISVENSLPVEDLIEQHFIQGCVEISNVSTPVNGSVNNISSYGYFEKQNAAFPFDNGIVITSGNINDIGDNFNNELLSAGENTWGSDADLELATGVSNTLNATTIEFEFIAGTNTLSFNYLLASEEYSNDFPCRFSDSFAFLIKPADNSEPYTNIAVIPGTDIPISTTTIHQEIVGFCDAENEEYFAGYNMGDTNFNGRTVPLTATASIEPNRRYRIKLIVADQRDALSDSAIFLQGNSFNTEVSLGPDISTCASSITLNANVNNPDASYTWFLNGNQLQQTTSSIVATEPGGNYRVVATIPLGNDVCTTEDSIEVSLSAEQNSTPLTSYELCDNDNDTTESFDLSIKNEEILQSVGNSGDYTITYYVSEDDAQNNTNAQTTITNTSNPQTVYVRIEENTNGCLAYNQFDLIVNPLPDIKTNVTLSQCDTGLIGYEEFNLGDATEDILNGETGMLITYHATEQEANSGINPLDYVYSSYNGTETVYARVRNPQTGCYSVAPLTLRIVSGPILGASTISVDACDPDHDGRATFNLVEEASPLLENLTDVSVSYHLSSNDALNGTNPITNTTNFENTNPFEQVIYIRFTNNTSSCVTLGYLRLFTNRLLSDTDLSPYYLCDDGTNDGIVPFDLLELETRIAASIPDVTVTYYLSENNRLNNVNPLDKTAPFNNTSNPQILYIRIDDPNCSELETIEIGVNPNIDVPNVARQTVCDTNQDGSTVINLNQYDELYTGGDPDLYVEYFLTEEDAEGFTNFVPEKATFTNTSNPQTLYARLTYGPTGCSNIGSFEIEVLPAPTYNIPADYLVCDNNTDGVSTVDLTSKIPEITIGTNNKQVTFYTRLPDANEAINPIASPNSYTTATATIFARVESTQTGCASIVPFKVIISVLPSLENISTYQYCEANNDANGEFIFNTKDADILNGQTGYQVLYYETMADANSRTNTINKTVAYNNTSNPQTIYARVESVNNQDCFDVASFAISVNESPGYNAPTDLFTCDDISNNGQELFNLAPVAQQIQAGHPEISSLSFHYSINDAQTDTDPLPNDYTNIDNPQTIFTRVESTNGCYEIVEFELNVIIVGLVNQPDPVIGCDNDYNGSTVFDLTSDNINVLGIRQEDVVLGYFENENDAENNTDPIAVPEAYVNTTNPQTVYVRATNTISNCYLVVPLELQVALPPTLSTFGTMMYCSTDNGTIDLTAMNNSLYQVPSEVDIAYFSTETDAQNNTNVLNNGFTYPGSYFTLFARVTYKETGCFVTTPVNIEINRSPEATTPPDLRVCTDDFSYIFNLAPQTPIIMGNETPANHKITYYHDQQDADMAANALSTEEVLSFEAINGDEIFARLEDLQTGCYDIASFNIYLDPFPLIPIEDTLTQCINTPNIMVNASTGNTNETYLWSTGATTPSITIPSIGNYWVTVTSEYNCSTTKDFTVIESQQASILAVETVSFTENNSITVTVSGVGDYLFVLNNGTPQEENTFTNVPIGYHTIMVIDRNGCETAVEQNVLVLGFPKFFTPNGDGVYDTWHIAGAQTIPNSTVRIFDRYGKLLTVLDADGPGWDGTYNGKHMPQDDYWFNADVIGMDKPFVAKGHFSLVRE
ncbi:choice-of-anchor L domain-containing protein [Galbibacter sp. PAP.153]|uniref:T9SS type B sorting domain-containing protein n=1 Tax=Galbibacter sp. PAP.153 TaxID=3104623 RepID=UPI00300AE0D0